MAIYRLKIQDDIVLLVAFLRISVQSLRMIQQEQKRQRNRELLLNWLLQKEKESSDNLVKLLVFIVTKFPVFSVFIISMIDIY